MITHRFQATLVIVFALLSTSTVSAQDPWLLRLAIESGGDEVVNVTFDNGDTDKIKAGGLIHLEAGKQFDLLENMPTQFSVGYKFDSVNASNGDIRFNRFTITALQFYEISEKFKIGAGLTYHLNPTLEVDAFGIDDEAEADNALGFMLKAGYSPNEIVNIGARVTQIEYESDIIEKASGDSVGVYISRYF